MPFIIPRILHNTFSSDNNNCRDGSGKRPQPELVVLDVAEGVTPVNKPPVRIFLGTEPAQYRAERIFIWSIERVRNPARVYEIYVMKELEGFDRRRWLTGFTNYRFAIPHYAGGKGKAIWNDVDQAYLSDPAELFDTDMGDYGILTVPPLSSSALLDTAVMLIDCERMASVWTGDDAKNGRKNNLLAKVQAVPELRGNLPAEWHARDEEYVPGGSKLMHWTILHTQPWHPLPELFVYQHNPVGQIWYDLESSADQAGYQVYSTEHPSTHYEKLLSRLQEASENNKASTQQIEPTVTTTDRNRLKTLIEHNKPSTLLEVCLSNIGDSNPISDSSFILSNDIQVSHYDPMSMRPTNHFDAVVCEKLLNYIPDEDVPWLIENLFEWAQHFVYVYIESSQREIVLADGTILQSRHHDLVWWKRWIESAARRHPQIQWKLVYDSSWSPLSGAPREIGWDGNDLPQVWVLNDDNPRDLSQALALAESLRWPYEIVLSPFDRTDKEPDLVIASNPQTGAWAQRLCWESSGRVRAVQIDSTGGIAIDDYDIVINPEYFHLPPHPRRIETTTRMSRVTPERLTEARTELAHLFGLAPQPHIVLLVGGDEKGLNMSVKAARQMGEEIRTFAHVATGSIYVLIDRFTRPRVAGALVAGLGESRHVYTRSPNQLEDEAYFAYLELADTLIVAGDDESLIADAAATGKPVYIYPYIQPRWNIKRIIREFVFALSQSRPLNKRGTIRPQQGLEYLGARLIEGGIVLPPHDLMALQQSLIRLGIIHPFGMPFDSTNQYAGLKVAQGAAEQVRSMTGLGEHKQLPEGGAELAHSPA